MTNRLCLGAMALAAMMSVSGCIPLIVGAGAGAGTAMWLSGKLVREFPNSFEQTLAASKRGLASMDLPITKATESPNSAQLRSTYTDGKEIWVDLHEVTMDSTKVEVRVGTVNSHQPAAAAIMKAIADSM